MNQLSAEAQVKRLAYSPAEAAVALGVNRATIFRMLARSELASVRAGKRRLIPAHVIERFLRGGADGDTPPAA